MLFMCPCPSITVAAEDYSTAYKLYVCRKTLQSKSVSLIVETVQNNGVCDLISHQFKVDYSMMNEWLLCLSLMNNQNCII